MLSFTYNLTKTGLGNGNGGGMRMMKLSFDFALHIIRFTLTLQTEKRFILANQIFKSGTSIGANNNEAQGAESKDDFCHKMKIAYKEAEETRYWLLLCKNSENYPDTSDLLMKIDQILRVLGKIISSTKLTTIRSQK